MSKSLDLITGGEASFEHSNWDRFEYLGLREFSAKIRDADEVSTRRHGRSLVEDAFYALGGNAPKETDPLGRAWSKAVKTPEFQTLRETANRDRTSQVIACMTMAVAVDKVIADANATPVDKQIDALKEAAKVDPTMARYLDAIADSSIVADELQKAKEAAQDAPAEFAIPVEAIADAQTKTEQMITFYGTVGGSLEGTPGERLDAAMDLGNLIDLKEFAKILGWANRVIGGASARNRGGSEELTGYRRSAWSDRVLPHQMIAVAEGDLQALAAVAENALTVRDYRSDTPSGKGPVILLRDESASMKPTHGENKHKKALAFETALAGAFNADGRDLISIPWAGTKGTTYIYGTPGLASHLSRFMNGGSTRPQTAVKEGVKLADEYVSGADLLILTDGEFSDAADTAAELTTILQPFKQNGGRAWGVMIGPETTGVRKSMTGWTDGWIAIGQIGEGDKLGEILGNMADRGKAGAKRSRL